MILMNIPLISMPTNTVTNRSLFWSNNPMINSLSSYSSSFKISCSTQKPQQNGDNGDAKDNSSTDGADPFSIDWNKAWSSFKKQSSGKKRSTQFNPNKYVTWNPRPSNYPLSEEVDPIKRTEKSNLMLWTSPRFTLFGAIVVVSLLLVYTLLAPIK